MRDSIEFPSEYQPETVDNISAPGDISKLPLVVLKPLKVLGILTHDLWSFRVFTGLERKLIMLNLTVSLTRKIEIFPVEEWHRHIKETWAPGTKLPEPLSEVIGTLRDSYIDRYTMNELKGWSDLYNKYPDE